MKLFKVKKRVARLHLYKQKLKTIKQKKMGTSILKSLFIGAIIGASIFFMPFCLGIFFFFFFISRIFFFRRMRMARHFGYHQMMMNDNIRSMSDDQYQQYRTDSDIVYLPKR